MKLEHIAGAVYELKDEADALPIGSGDPADPLCVSAQIVLGELQRLRRELAMSHTEVARLRGLVTEWICPTCREVWQGPAPPATPRQDKCPSCLTTTLVPHSELVIQELQAQVAELEQGWNGWTYDEADEARPRRRFDVRIRIDADTWDAAVRRIDDILPHIVKHGPTCNTFGGGWSDGHIVEVKERPEITHEIFATNLDAYLEKLDKAGK